MAIVMCHNETKVDSETGEAIGPCPSMDRPIEIAISGVDDEGNAWTSAAVMCGDCGQQITDIQDV